MVWQEEFLYLRGGKAKVLPVPWSSGVTETTKDTTMFAKHDTHEADNVTLTFSFGTFSLFSSSLPVEGWIRKPCTVWVCVSVFVHTSCGEAQENHWERRHGRLMPGILASSAAPDGLHWLSCGRASSGTAGWPFGPDPPLPSPGPSERKQRRHVNFHLLRDWKFKLEKEFATHV